MFKVIIVDDEPTAVSHIRMIIQKKCSQFTVIGEARNGEEALQKVAKYEPDLLITDIRMPIMNGIDLVRKVKNEFPSIYSIFISGHQDFEYAKEAIQSGVLDYVLKPITSTSLISALNQIAKKLNANLSQTRNKLIHNISRGIIPSDEAMEKCFSSEKYYAAIIRKNGLQRRFSSKFSIEIFSGVDESIYLYGRDEMEALYIYPEEMMLSESFEELIGKDLKKEQYNCGYTTTVIGEKGFLRQKLYDVIRALYKTLDSKIVIGHTQIIYLESKEEIETVQGDDDNMRLQIQRLIKEENWEKFKKEFTTLMHTWKYENRPQLWVERNVKLAFYYIQIQHSKTVLEEYEFILEEAFFYATTVNELIDNLLDIFKKIFYEDNLCMTKVDTQEFIEKIKSYMKRHLTDQLTLKYVSKEFGISQTYLSKLFRKYEDTSFNNYMTSIRIECAKKLIKQNRNFLVKDIAFMVGYRDQFYFSRVFCSVTGTPPSVYAESFSWDV